MDTADEPKPKKKRRKRKKRALEKPKEPVWTEEMIRQSVRPQDVPYLNFIQENSNKAKIKTALQKVCLTGRINRSKYSMVEAQMDKFQAERFVILLRSSAG